MPLLDLIWVMLIWFLFLAWILVITVVVTDIFRSDDLSGLRKAAWILFVIVIPWLGVIVYLVARGDSLTYRYMEALGRRERRRIGDPREGVPLGVGYRSSSNYRQTGMAAAMDFDTQSARVLR